MAKFKPIVVLDMKVSQSDIAGILDINEDGELCICVDDKSYVFDEIKDYFIGGTIEIHNLSPISEE